MLLLPLLCLLQFTWSITLPQCGKECIGNKNTDADKDPLIIVSLYAHTNLPFLNDHYNTLIILLYNWEEIERIGNKNRHADIDPSIILGPAVRVFANGPGDLGSIPGRVIPKTLKMVLDTTLLNTQHYKVRFKGKVLSNPGNGVAPSPTPWCSSYRKGSLRVTLDYGR